MRFFSDESVAAKYERLGFSAQGLLLELKVGNVSISAAEHPWRGVVLMFQGFEPRSMCQLEAQLPTRCSVEQIAGLIYLNIAQNFRADRDACKKYFEAIGIPLFQ